MAKLTQITRGVDRDSLNAVNKRSFNILAQSVLIPEFLQN